MKKQLRLGLILAVSIILVVLAKQTSFAKTCDHWFAKAVSVQGSVQVKSADNGEWLPVRLNDTFCDGDVIRVLEAGRADIILTDQQTLRIDQNTTIALKGVTQGKTSLVEIVKGMVHFFSRFRQSLRTSTPFVNATVEGTEFLVKVDTDRTFISLFEGQIMASNNAGSLLLNRGQSAVAVKGKAPELQVVVRPRDAVQWTLYYPAVLSCGPSDLSKKTNDPRFHTCNAMSLLTVGRINQARSEIDSALKISPSDSNAMSLQTIIAVARNNKEEALMFADKAVKSGPKSAAAYIALSYAQQANFDLTGALNSLKEAVRVEPADALAWARLSELNLSFGDLRESSKAAEKAVALKPELSRTRTVMGFAYLARVRTAEAMDAFNKAIESDQADPLPRLGLGLALIREGKLAEGRTEIEIAVSLDPGNSLIRSYLGKAYYEEKRDTKAEGQFLEAKELDPKDPTPFFYDAIMKQSINRPVEALHDMQKAIELNDNRAVYRSEFLLDSDLAARSASLARIYTDLGFQDLALAEGWKSVNADPADFSAHRFLSDSYSVLPRHEIARVSELLQSQLLQPINITPLQPHLAESNLAILDGAGPTDLSFNEFNPLFNRNRYSLLLSGIAGGNSTFGDEAVVSAVQGKVSLSAGQFHYETDGFRENNDQKQDIYNLFAQVALSPQTSVQAEFRSRDFEHGDLSVYFGPENFDRNERDTETFRTVRLGLHHSFTPKSDFIGSVIYRSSEHDFNNLLGQGYDINIERDGYLAEIQHLYRTEAFKIVGGAGYFRENQENTFIGQTSENHPRHTNAYVYSYINYPGNMIWTIGGSANSLKTQIADKTLDRDRLSPKFGLVWNPFQNTTVRLAAFRTLNRVLISDQTIEPTQVAGFNQFFNDTEGTISWRYGAGIDQKLTSQLFGGVEFSKRDLKVPGVTFDEETFSSKLIEGEWKEELVRVYSYWTPHPWLAMSVGYQFEKFKRPEEFDADYFARLNTHRVMLGIGFFHPSGLSVRLNPSYISQNGEIDQITSGPFVIFKSEEDSFWVFDASVSYRLPKRMGMLSIAGKNLFDKSFKFQDTDPRNPEMQPKRLILAKFTLEF
jgi:tetratricopeptide (TPR) repeat protein